MEIPILVEPLSSGRFRARTGEPMNLSADGDTEQEAVRELGIQCEALLAHGSRLATLTIKNGKSVPSQLPADNAHETDWVFREMQDAIAEQRRQEEAARE